MKSFVCSGGAKLPLALLLATVFVAGRDARALEVIAHRGAQAHKPENTLASEQLAQKMGAHWLECDLVATKDHRLILSHDTALEHTTNIAEAFPARKRKDGHYYAIDFTLAELKTLKMRPRVNDDGKRAFPKRPIDATGASITTLEELLTIPKGHFYIEFKSPAWHRKNGADISKLALPILEKSKVPVKSIRLQCFDASELKRLRGELKSPYFQTQLLKQNKAMFSPEALGKIRKYADAIGPRLDAVISLTGITPLVANAHAAGLQVHPYSFQTDVAPFTPPLTQNFIRAFENAKIEAIFTDQPDEVLALLSKPGSKATAQK